MTNTLDRLVEEVGGCGRYQFLLVPLAIACLPMSVWSMLHMVFGALEPDWWCVSRDLLRNASRHHGLNGSIDGVYAAGNGGGVSSDVWDGGDLDEGGVLSDNASFKTCGADGGRCQRIVFESGLNTVVSQVGRL